MARSLVLCLLAFLAFLSFSSESDSQIGSPPGEQWYCIATLTNTINGQKASGWGKNPDLNKARERALRECRKDANAKSMGGDCQVVCYPPKGSRPRKEEDEDEDQDEDDDE